MRLPRTLVIGSFAAAMLVTTVAAPVAAAKTKLAIVNGIPGKKVDVCVNGREVKSGLRYGRFFFKTTRTAKATVKFYKRDPRRCGGKLLAKTTSGLDDATWVITRRHPLKIVVFDNSILAQPIGADDARGAYRHAADISGIRFGVRSDLADPAFPFHPSDHEWFKGSHWDFVTSEHPLHTLTTFVRTIDGDVNLVRPFPIYVVGGRRLEWIIVGTGDANARLVFIDRPAKLVLP